MASTPDPQPNAPGTNELPRPLSYHVAQDGTVHLESAGEAPGLPEATQTTSASQQDRHDTHSPPSASRGTNPPPASPGPRPVMRVLRWARRISQGAFLAVFLLLLTQTTFRGSLTAAPSSHLRWPVDVFFLFDPLAALLTTLSSHRLHAGLALSGVTIALTIVFGRVFCGWVCPFGTIHHVTAWLLPSRHGKGSRRIKANRHRARLQQIKYLVLYFSLGAAFMGSALGGLLDPIALSVRGLGLSLSPVAQYVTGAVAESANASHIHAMHVAAGQTQDALASAVWQGRQFHYQAGWFIGLVFIGLVFMNRFIPRFWCRYLCPLGALLGLLSRFSLFGMQKDEAKCTNCNLCLLNCQGADNPQGGEPWQQQECFMCFNCEMACPEDVIHFRFLPNRKSSRSTPDTTRRAVLTATTAGAALVPALRASDGLRVNYNPKLIRPPGALDEVSFLDRCIRCGECMKVCPSNALHPALLEGGIEGLWTPVLIPRIGYCEHSCTLCTQVCPTGALRPLTVAEKVGNKSTPPVKLGTAFYDRGRCLPWSMETPCIVCEEFCPTSPKAIWVEDVEIPRREATRDGDPPTMTTIHLQRPHVDPSLCIGCGTCENVCPVQDKPAIRVTNVGESRSPTNVILLREERPS